jgi:hypothetical protein
MFSWDKILCLMAHSGSRVGFVGSAACFLGLLDNEGLVALRMQVGDEIRFLILDAKEGGRKSRAILASTND